MALQASFAEAAPRKAQEWSPIDRMLANKRSSKRSSPKKQRASLELPPLPQQQRAPAPAARQQRAPAPAPQEQRAPVPARTAAAGSQTAAWHVLVAEATAPERARVQALQAQLKALRTQTEEHEEAAAIAQVASASVNAANATLALELQAVKQQLEEERAARDAEREQWAVDREWLQDEVAATSGAEKRGVEELERLRAEVRRSKDDVAALRKKCGALQQDSEALARERDALAEEKSHLLQRLEVEQAEMIARVDALQRKMSERPAKVR